MSSFVSHQGGSAIISLSEAQTLRIMIRRHRGLVLCSWKLEEGLRLTRLGRFDFPIFVVVSFSDSTLAPKSLEFVDESAFAIS